MILDKHSKINLTVIIIISLTIAILMRLILAWQTHDLSSFTIDGNFISIFSPDPALYGYYANLLLQELPHNSDVNMIEYFIYYIVKYSSFTLDQVMYFGPAFFASLILIPTILILSLYINSLSIMFLSALISSLGYGYYGRTYLGYFDTDVLNVFFPMMILYGMLLVIRKEDYRYSIISILANISFLLWYHSSEPIVYALNGFFILFCLVFFPKNSTFYKVSILFGISIIKITLLYKFIILFILFIVFYFLKIHYKYYLGLFTFSIIFVIYKIDLSQFSFHLDRYFFKSENLQNLNYKFLAPMQLVSEARGTDLFTIIRLISGNIYIFSIAIMGYILFVFRHKEFLLTLPLLLVGIMSIKAGIRFHIFGVPILILAYAYFVFYFTSKFKNNFIKIFLVALFLLYPLYENARSVKFWNTKVAKPVFNPEQIKALQTVKGISSSKDYAVTWWDYGWPIWYYTSMKTMIDNGKHHEDNYTVAKILMSTSQTFSFNAIHHFYDLYSKRNTPAIMQALKKEKNISSLLKKLSDTNMKHKKNVDKYLVLPIQMTKLIYTIFTFSNIDPSTGKKLKKKLFLEYNKIGEDSKYITLDKNIKIDKKNALLIQNGTKIPIKNFYHILIKNNQKLMKEINAHKVGLHIINYNGKYYIVDDYFLNTTFVQLMFFNNYNKKYFEPIYTGNSISIFKVK